jgi:hypothetical protein
MASTRQMTKGQKVKVVLNREAFHQIDLANTDGLMAVAEEIIHNVRTPDAPPYGRGLLQGGGWLAYLGSKKIGGQMEDGRNVSKPRSLRDTTQVAIAGWGFPGRFVELGTVDTHAEPFLTKSVMEVLPSADVVLSKRIQGRLQGLRDPKAALRYTGSGR